MICGEISHVLDFRGNSLCVDTACASGLSALALAKDEVSLGRAEGAVAVGAFDDHHGFFLLLSKSKNGIQKHCQAGWKP